MERREREIAGDGQAVFMTDMTDEEYAVHILEEDHGWREFYDRVLGRKKDDPAAPGTRLESHPVTGSDHDPQAIESEKS